jgi:hypothetical protein
VRAIVVARIALSPLVAVARVIERRVRTSSRVARPARFVMAALARRSRGARTFVRLRVMPLV